MVYLHENKEEFRNAVNLASERSHILPVVAEKDYYVTMILRGLSERLGFVVFKGFMMRSLCKPETYPIPKQPPKPSNSGGESVTVNIIQRL